MPYNFKNHNSMKKNYEKKETNKLKLKAVRKKLNGAHKSALM